MPTIPKVEPNPTDVLPSPIKEFCRLLLVIRPQRKPVISAESARRAKLFEPTDNFDNVEPVPANNSPVE